MDKYHVFDNMIEGVQIISPQWRYLYVNDAVVEHSKLTRAELLGFTMMEKYPGIEDTNIFKAIVDCMTTKNPHQIVDEFVFPDNSKNYFQLRVQSTDEGVLVFSYDVTEQKVAEELIKRTNTELEDLIFQRTKELSEKNKIIENQVKRLEELNNTKDKFFSIVAHDFKSPLNSLKSFSNLLINHFDHLSKDEILTMSHQLKASVDNTVTMADNLITWARVQMNKLQYNEEVIAVRDIISSIYEVYKEIAFKKGIEMDCSIEDSITVLGDRNQIEFIVRNLINNAIKFTHKGGLVSLMAKLLSVETVQIAISDSGVGIPDELKIKLFSIANKQSTNGTEGEKGTGLGLALSYEFLKLNGGQIDIDSTIGKGTTFYTKFRSGFQKGFTIKVG